MKIHHLNPIAERIAEVTAEPRNQFQPVLLRDLLAHLGELHFIANHYAEMPHAVGLHFLDFEHREELMLAELEERIAFSFVKLLQIENVLVERDRLLHVIHFDGDMIASVNLHAHTSAFC